MADAPVPPAGSDPVPDPPALLEAAGPEVAAGEPYQSLYRRYRPQRFDEVRGQDHVTRALRNAVRDAKVAHAYLFSGPRGTGKTSTARILAMALNCEHPVDGEPDGTCPSCIEIRRGSSLDVHELDAASNRKLDEMRDLLSRVALGTSGRWKVYIVDEVHQLTSDAASALLKTLEEPPAHVVFVLATTDPQKVLPTIRSRTQHFEFRLLGAEVLGELLHDVNDKAALGLKPDAIDLVVRRGHGSARDALSVLDQVAAAGDDVEDDGQVVSDIVEALAERDPGRVLTSIAEAMSAGRDPRRLAVDLLEHLRNGFLATQARSLVLLPEDAVAEVEAQARRLGLAGVVKALDVIGQAGVDMRDAVDPRVTLEAALVRVSAPAIDDSSSGLVERIERLEQQIAQLTVGGGVPRGDAAPAAPVRGEPAGPVRPAAAAPPAPVSPAPAPVSPVSPSPAPPRPAPASAAPVNRAPQSRPAPEPCPAGASRSLGAPPPMPGQGAATGGTATGETGPMPAATGPGPAARPVLGAHRRRADDAGGQAEPGVPQGQAAGSASGADAAPGAGVPTGREAPGSTGAPSAGPTAAQGAPSRDELTKAWGDIVLPGLRPGVKAYVAAGRFVPSPQGNPTFALPDPGLVERARPMLPEIDAALAQHFGRRVEVTLVVDGESAPPGTETGSSEPEDDAVWELDDLQDAGPGVISPEQRLLEAFPGAEEVTP